MTHAEMQALGAFAGFALALRRQGYSPIPIRVGEKRPLFEKWDRLRTEAMSEEEITDLARRCPRLGLGVAGGYNGLVPLDIDTDAPDIRAAIRKVVPVPLVVKRGATGATAFFRDPTGLIIGGRKYRPPAVNGVKQKPLVEVLVTGQTVLPPTLHPKTGRPYRYTTDDTLLEVQVHEHPIITPQHLLDIEGVLSPWVPKPKVFEPRPVGAKPVSDKRMLACAVHTLEKWERDLRSRSEGRNDGLFNAICEIGKFVRHDILRLEEVRYRLIQCSIDNGYTSKRGKSVKSAMATFDSGYDRTIDDELPTLKDRPLKAA